MMVPDVLIFERSPRFFFLSFSSSVACLMCYSFFILCLHLFACVYPICTHFTEFHGILAMSQQQVPGWLKQMGRNHIVWCLYWDLNLRHCVFTSVDIWSFLYLYIYTASHLSYQCPAYKIAEELPFLTFEMQLAVVHLIIFYFISWWFSSKFCVWISRYLEGEILFSFFCAPYPKFTRTTSLF